MSGAHGRQTDSPAYRRARAAVNQLSRHPAVRAASLVAPDEDPTNDWLVELAVDYSAVDETAPEYAIGPKITQEIGRAGLWMKEVSPRADWMTVKAVAGDPL